MAVIEINANQAWIVLNKSEAVSEKINDLEGDIDVEKYYLHAMVGLAVSARKIRKRLIGLRNIKFSRLAHRSATATMTVLAP